MGTIYTFQNETDLSGSVAPNDVVCVYDTSAGRTKAATVGGTLCPAPVNCTASTLTVTAASHAGTVVTLNRAAGIAVTLPAASGTGYVFRFLVGTTVTSNTTTIKVVGDDTMTGLAVSAADGGASVNGWETASDSDTITFDGTTTGGVKGDFVELIDVASDLWYVRVTSSSTGTEATPFSATVS